MRRSSPRRAVANSAPGPLRFWHRLRGWSAWARPAGIRRFWAGYRSAAGRSYKLCNPPTSSRDVLQMSGSSWKRLCGWSSLRLPWPWRPSATPLKITSIS
ncbi:unnamed protein product, partial [Symbiodinium necroappetens]